MSLLPWLCRGSPLRDGRRSPPDPQHPAGAVTVLPNASSPKHARDKSQLELQRDRPPAQPDARESRKLRVLRPHRLVVPLTFLKRDQDELDPRASASMRRSGARRVFVSRSGSLPGATTSFGAFHKEHPRKASRCSRKPQGQSRTLLANQLAARDNRPGMRVRLMLGVLIVCGLVDVPAGARAAKSLFCGTIRGQGTTFGVTVTRGHAGCARLVTY
jgi:hypothetical protein